MKIKRLLLGMAIVAVAGVNVYRMNAKSAQLSDLQMENIEMLASAQEGGEGAFLDCGYAAVDWYTYDEYLRNRNPYIISGGETTFITCQPGCLEVSGYQPIFNKCQG